jgi:hypothetical protein
MDFDRNSIRHAVATVAYRAAKTIRGAPPAFAACKVAPSTRTPVEIVAHLGDLFDWALRMAKGEMKWTTAAPQPWPAECARFFASLKAFDDHLASPSPIACELTRLFQGPVADALTHIGQLAMLRRLAGAPMKGESYNRADVAAGRVGFEQIPADPRFEFD